MDICDGEKNSVAWIASHKVGRGRNCFLRSFRPILSLMDINMEMGKGMERMQGTFGHVEDAIRVEFFKMNPSNVEY